MRQALPSLHRLLVRVKLRALPDARLTEVERFYRDGGNDLRTRKLGLHPTDVALDFGGYHGDYAADLRRLYGCSVHVFEPVPAFAELIRHRFARDPRVVVHEAAVGRRAGTLRMHVEADASGAFAAGPAVEVPVVAAAGLARRLPERIALLKMNIEGGEYDLIPALDEARLLERVDRLFVQFHDIGADSADRRRACQQILGKTHTQNWDYPFVWEAWSRTSASRPTSLTSEDSIRLA